MTVLGVRVCAGLQAFCVKLHRHRSTSVCQEAVTLAHIIADDTGCSSRARPTININGQEQVDWELSYQGGPS